MKRLFLLTFALIPALLRAAPEPRKIVMDSINQGADVAATKSTASSTVEIVPKSDPPGNGVDLLAQSESTEALRQPSSLPPPPEKKLKIFVLTGQSNSLGTLAGTDGTMQRDAPGTHPTEQGMHVPFFWDNLVDGTTAGDAALGDSGGNWVDLGPQTGGYYPSNDHHWGPEIGFARMLWNAGYRDFGIVKTSRGGGGNSFWVKDSPNDEMYDKVVSTVNSATANLPNDYTSYEIAGLLYVQGESNDATEATEANGRFSALLANLKVDLSNATDLKGTIGEIGGGASPDRDLTRIRQKTLATSRADIGYASSAGTSQHDGIHYTADSQLLIGERMAAEMIGTGALGTTPMPAWDNLYAWYVADNAAQPGSAGTIDRWASLNNGSAARDLTRSVGGRPIPHPVTTTSGQAREVMEFNGNQDLWASSAEFGALPDERSVAVLCRVKSPGDGFLFDGTTGVGRTRAQVRAGNWQVGVSTSTWDAAEPITAARVLETWQNHVFTFDDTGSGTQVRHWIDGAEVAAPPDPNLSDLAGLIIGANGGSPFSRLSCEIAEFAVYHKVLAAAEVAELDAAWSARWGSPGGPPFGVTVNQTSREIARFGKHALLEIEVTSPTIGATTLNQISLTLKGTSRDRITSISVMPTGTGASFDPSAPVLASISSPTENVITFPLSAALVEGSNRFWIAVEADRWAELGTTLDARLDQLVFSGVDAGSIIPSDGDPAGQLTLALVPFEINLRVKGAHGLNANYRIPGIACDGHGVLHAVYDNRYNYGQDLPGDIDVAYNRSTDGGATWEAQKIILDFDSSVSGSSGNGVGDPCILVDPATDTIWVAALWSFGNRAYIGSGPGTAPSQTGQFVLTKSTDGGNSWSAPINITTAVKDDTNWNLIFDGPGHGLAMRDGTLVFPAQYRDGSISNDGANQVRSCSVFSSDHGATWDFGTAVPSTNPETNEMTLCELDNGKILFSCRTPAGSNGQRAWAHYTPGGTVPMRDGTWEPLYRLAQVPDPVCQGSVIQWKSTFQGHPREMLLFANPATGGRNGMTLRVSLDGGLSWPISRLVYAGSSAYSSLCILPDNSIGLLYEKDDYHSITFVRLEEDWILNPSVDTDADGLPNSWEAIWGTNSALADAGEDPDGDGMTNLQEFLAGTNPLDAASRLRSTRFENRLGELDFSWSSVPGRFYQLEDSTDLELWSPLGTSMRGATAETAVTIPDEGTLPRRFIRARPLR